MIYSTTKRIGKKYKKNDPFFIKKGKKAVLMLHMMGQSPNEFKELASYLTKRGIIELTFEIDKTISSQT